MLASLSRVNRRAGLDVQTRIAEVSQAASTREAGLCCCSSTPPLPIPAPPMLTGLLSTMFSDRPAVDDVFGEVCRRLLQLMLVSQQHQVQMNLLFHPMIAVSKAGRSNSAAAAGLQYCSRSDSAGRQNCSAAARLSSNNCPAATARTAVPQRQHGSVALADQLWHRSGRGRPRAAQPQQQHAPHRPLWM